MILALPWLLSCATDGDTQASLEEAERGPLGPCGTEGALYVFDASASTGVCRAFIGEWYGPGGSLEEAATAAGATAAGSCPTAALQSCCVIASGSGEELVDYGYLHPLVDATFLSTACQAAGGAFTPLDYPPAVEITSPVEPTVSGTIEVQAEVLDAGTVVEVDLFVDGESQRPLDEEEWEWDWDTCREANGTHTLQVVALDDDGESGEASLEVVVDNPLEAVIVSPRNSTVGGATTLYAEVAGGAGDVSVSWSIDGAEWGDTARDDGESTSCETGCDGGCLEYVAEADAYGLSEGDHQLTLTVTDSAGNTVTDEVRIRVTYDADQDGWDAEAFGGEDCDDADNDTFPGAAEIDSATSCMQDSDGDGYGNNDPAAGVRAGTDCDDSDDEIFPGRAALDSSTLCMQDNDEDGYGDQNAPAGVSDGTDCNDSDDEIFPGATETCDRVDEDCNGLVDDGTDADGDGSSSLCDCDDTNADVSPSATEVCENGLDDDCDGAPSGCGVDDGSLAAADVSWTGSGRGASVGIALAGREDIDGDGAIDVILGASEVDGGSGPGAAYLMLGAGTLGSGTISLASSTWTGIDNGDEAGCSVSLLGDVDDDGVNDVLIGARKNADAGTDAGAAYLLSGVDALVGGSLEDATATFLGTEAGGFAGHAVASAGDVDDDGIADLLVSAYQAQSSFGLVYLILGSPSLVSDDLSSASAVYEGENSSDQAGYGLDGAADFNADGFDDIAIGAYYNDDGGTKAGAAYIVFGSGSPTSSSLTGTDLQFTGEDDEDVAGWSVAFAGDVNDDGFDDLLVGAKWNDNGADEGGAASLVLGGSAVSSGSLSLADATYAGTSDDDYAGSAVAAAGDVDDDGFDDMLVGAPGAGSGGYAYLVRGSALPSSTVLSAADAALTAASSGDYAGHALAGVGDIDADGYDDVGVGAYSNDDGASGAGAVYLLLGGSI